MPEKNQQGGEGRGQRSSLHTGENAPEAGFYKSQSGTIVRMQAGNHLPPDPSSRGATEWEFLGEKQPEGYREAA